MNIKWRDRIKRKEIQALRVSLKMTRIEFAEDLGVSKWAIYKYESGDRSPSKPVMKLMQGLK